MIAADLGRALALGSIPLAYAFDALSLAQLYAVAFATGALAVVFDVSYLSYLPGLVARERIAEGNSKLLASQSGAQVVGPGVAGALVGAVGAPVAITADAASFGISAALVSLIRRREPEREASPRRRLREELWEGVRYVFGHSQAEPDRPDDEAVAGRAEYGTPSSAAWWGRGPACSST